MYVCVERFHTNYLRQNQAALKVKNYQGLRESLENKDDLVGKKVILPLSFIGSPRSMSQLYQDARSQKPSPWGQCHGSAVGRYFTLCYSRLIGERNFF
jgi:hypothetical protein